MYENYFDRFISGNDVVYLSSLEKYNDIEIHEKTKEVGGSWKASNFYNLKSVETGTHILAPWKTIGFLKVFKYSQKKNRLKAFFS